MPINQLLNILFENTLQTLYMVILSSIVGYILGLPLGVILVITDKQGIRPNPVVNVILGAIVNIVRSVPFLILAVTIMPFTRFLVHTTLGSTATAVALIVSSTPYIARLVESSLKEVDAGVIEAARSMGASTFQIIYKVLIPEAKPSLLVGIALAMTTILGYSAIAGFIGGGGLGDVALQYGYNRGDTKVMIIMVAALVVIVQIIQEVGMRLTKRLDKRNH